MNRLLKLKVLYGGAFVFAKEGFTYDCHNISQGLFTWSGGPLSSRVGFFCFHALEDTKQKKPTPLDRGPPLHVNRVLVYSHTLHIRVAKNRVLRRLLASKLNLVIISAYTEFQLIKSYCFCRIDWTVIKMQSVTPHNTLKSTEGHDQTLFISTYVTVV